MRSKLPAQQRLKPKVAGPAVVVVVAVVARIVAAVATAAAVIVIAASAVDAKPAESRPAKS
jgi:hypothetical protein